MTTEHNREGEVVYLSEELKQAEKDSAERESALVAEKLVGKAKDIVAAKKDLSKASDDLFLQSIDALQKGVLSVEQMLGVMESFDNPVERSVLLRKCVVEAVKQGNSQLTEELLEKEPDNNIKERLRGVIAITLNRMGKHAESAKAVEEMPDGQWKDNAIKVIKEEEGGAKVASSEDSLVN